MSERPLKFSSSLLMAWQLAEIEAAHRNQLELEPEDFFLGLLKLSELDVKKMLEEKTALSSSVISREARFVGDLASAFAECSLETKKVRRKLRASLHQNSDGEGSDKPLRRSPSTRSCFKASEELARGSGSNLIQPNHLLIALLKKERESIKNLIEEEFVSSEQLISAVKKAQKAADTESAQEAPQASATKLADIQTAEEPPAKNLLFEKLGRDLTQLAKDGKLSPIIGRKSEIKSLIQTLLRSRKNNAILIGEAGVGKTGIVEGLAQRIVSGKVPQEFSNKTVIEISMGSLMAGTTYRGDIEARVQRIIKEAQNNPNLVIFIDEIHLIMGSGKSEGSSMDVANLLKPALARGDIRVIGATTTNEYRQSIEKDSALERRFQPITVKESTPSEAEAILLGLRPKIEKHHGVSIEDDAITSAVSLSIRYLPDFRLPDKALDLIDQACAMSRFKTLTAKEFASPAKLSISQEQIITVIAERCGIPADSIQPDDNEKLNKLESILQERVKGQNHAISKVADAIRSAKAGLKKATKPVGSFLFVGPSGTGKTELAKALAESLYDDEGSLIRLDMSEFMEDHSISKLIGTPPGYRGHEEGGQLSNAIRRKPHSVVLFDEIEKAHPKVLDIFLQIFDEGTLTDSSGKKCNFRESLIILTSNLGAQKAAKKAFIGFTDGEKNPDDESNEQNEQILRAIKSHMRPELINRLTSIVTFQPISRSTALEILEKIIEELNERISGKGISVSLDSLAIECVLDASNFENNGARHIESTLNSLINSDLTEALLEKSGEESHTITYTSDCGKKLSRALSSGSQ